jgi:hypothetical protein
MNTELFWLVFWPFFIFLCYYLIQLSVKRFERLENEENSKSQDIPAA